MRCTIGASIWSLSCFAIAGSLVPPGAPGPTMKTLTEVEPRIAIHSADLPLVISQPGSYYLAENIKVQPTDPVTTAAISIESDHVTIDLNGFALAGSNTNGTSGIVANGTMANLTVKNGYVASWEEYGIFMDVRDVHIKNVTANQNHGYAMWLTAGRVVNCVACENLAGIYFYTSTTNPVARPCVMDRCTVISNGETGVYSRIPIKITNTNSSHNFGNGMSLYGPRSVVENCVANFNSASGIMLTSDAVNGSVSGNTCNDNDETGIVIIGKGTRTENNHAANNQGYGIKVDQRSMVFKNTAYDNDIANYSLVSEAVAGPIVTTTTGGIVDSDHPWANFSFHSTKIGN